MWSLGSLDEVTADRVTTTKQDGVEPIANLYSRCERPTGLARELGACLRSATRIITEFPS